MSTKYHKIQTAWLRDPGTDHKTLIEGAWSKPEFEYLKHADWTFTEKVDGMNIRVICDGHGGIDVRGKTDNAQIPPGIQFFADGLALAEFVEMTLYCEGYGPKIQSGGKYRVDPALVLFDVWCGGLWLERKDVEDIGQRAGVEVVPIIGRGPLEAMIQDVRHGFSSIWGTAMAEGIVARPEVELQNRRGERVITKLKAKDFPR